MAVLIRTSDVPAAHRYDAWRSIVCDALGPLDFRSDPDVPPSGEIEAGHLGPASVGRVQTSTPHSVLRRRPTTSTTARPTCRTIFAARLDTLVKKGRRADAVELFSSPCP